MPTPSEIRVSIDVGCHCHSVAIGLFSGEVLDEFDLAHRPEGFELFFERVEASTPASSCGKPTRYCRPPPAPCSATTTDGPCSSRKAARAHLREVTPGQRSGLAVQILDGLKEGENVIIHPDETVSDGVRITER